MTQQEKYEFINELTENVRKDLITKLVNVPENWDGIELRHWIADKFADAAYRKMEPKRLRSYRNDVIVNNL